MVPRPNLGQQPAPAINPAPAAAPPTPAPTVLLVSTEAACLQELIGQLRALGCGVLGPATSGAQALDLARQGRPSLAMVDAALMHGDQPDGAEHWLGQIGAPAVLMAAGAGSDHARAAARPGVFGYLTLPSALEGLRAGLAIATARHLEAQGLRDEVQRLQQMLADRKIIEKAKGLVMKEFKLSEEDAMRRLQKQARDSRRKVVEVARSILDAQSTAAQRTNTSPSPTKVDAGT
jgi:two-component system, response regulator PdtaR